MGKEENPMLKLTLKELLEDRLAFLESDDISNYIRLVFWKENGQWREYCFCLKKDNSISLSTFKTLLWIKNTDKQAVVIDKCDFIASYLNAGRMIHVIEKAYNEIDDCHNINEFLKKIVKIQGLPEFDITRFLEFNREEFFQTELGEKLIDTINHFRVEMLTDDPHIERFQAIIDTIFLALK